LSDHTLSFHERNPAVVVDRGGDTMVSLRGDEECVNAGIGKVRQCLE